LFPALVSSVPLSQRVSPSQEGYQCGFTLLELLVVVFIIAVIAGMAVISTGNIGVDRLLEQEARRARVLFGLAAQEAMLQGRPLGVVVEPQAYRFLVAGNEDWAEFQYSGPLRERQLLDGFQLSISNTEQAGVFDFGQQQQKEGTPSPQILFFPTGEMNPFSLSFQHLSHQGGYILQGQENGRMELLRKEQFR
jgi:general secretion pathway protein H